MSAHEGAALDVEEALVSGQQPGPREGWRRIGRPASAAGGVALALLLAAGVFAVVRVAGQASLRKQSGILSLDELPVAAPGTPWSLDWSLWPFPAGKELPEGPTRQLLEDLKPCAPCSAYERFGEEHDGGYILCTDGLGGASGGPLVAALSYGVNGFDGWGTMVSNRYKLPVHEFDCFVLKEPEGGDLRFHGECVKGAEDTNTDPKFKTLLQQMEETGTLDVPDGSLLLKMDIEGAEWNVLMQEPVSTWKKFQQLVVEFHWLEQAGAHEVYAKALENLREAGFVVTHLHGNNYHKMIQFGDYYLPDLVEATFIRLPHGKTCSADVPYHLPIDATNVPQYAELRDARLP